MSTYREIVYMALDEIKSISDDSFIQPEHVIFLMDKYRAMILKQKYADIKKEIPESNYQTICLDLTKDKVFDDDDCSSVYLRSVQKVPSMLEIAEPKVYPKDFFGSNITYVSKERLKFVGSNKYLKNIIYAALSPKDYLYLKSGNLQYSYLQKLEVTAIFEDSAKASELDCSEDNACDLLDRKYPLEEGLIANVLQLIVKDILGVEYRPADSNNNASDDLSNLAYFLRRNSKSDLAKQIEGND